MREKVHTSVWSRYPPPFSGMIKGESYCFLGLTGQVVEAVSVFVSLNKKSCIAPMGPINDIKNAKLYKKELIFIIQILYVSRGRCLATMQLRRERKDRAVLIASCKGDYIQGQLLSCAWFLF